MRRPLRLAFTVGSYQSSLWTKRARIKYGFTTNGKWSLTSASLLTQDGHTQLDSKDGITVPLASLGRAFALAPGASEQAA